MKKIFIFVFLYLILSVGVSEAAKPAEIRLVIKNMAGYTIHHMDITLKSELPKVDLLPKPLKDKEAIDVYLKNNFEEDLVLWIMNEDYSNLSIIIGKNFENIDHLEIKNNGSIRFVEKRKLTY